MENKLQELTQKLYNEGVEKANAEAEEILANARKEAEKVRQDAADEAKRVVEEAEQKATDLKKNTEAELSLAAKQLVREVQQQVAQAILAKVVDKPMKDAFDEKEFVKKLVETAIANWNPQEEESIDLTVILPESMAGDLSEYLQAKAKKELNANLEVQVSDNMKGGFKIGPADGSYIISFSEEDFGNFFKSYLRPRTNELLFEGE
ncbi:MAG: hypothetical protein R6U66_07670 [Bacteroidales bacterium]|jgi:V/A-type H+-transporting ATPase subunit E